MTEVYRICQNCGEQSQLSTSYCPHCGANVATGVPVTSQKHLPIPTGKALLPLAAGAVGLLARAAWKLVQSKEIKQAALHAVEQVVQDKLSGQQGSKPAARTTTVHTKSRRTIRIQSRWAVGNEAGVQRRGQSEHIIEIDD